MIDTAKANPSSDHHRLVESVVAALKDLGYDEIKAVIDGYQSPGNLPCYGRLHEPDAIATGRDAQAVVVEVETADSIASSRTAIDWKLTFEFCRQQGKRFVVVVPQGSKQTAEERIRQLGMEASVLEA